MRRSCIEDRTAAASTLTVQRGWLLDAWRSSTWPMAISRCWRPMAPGHLLTCSPRGITIDRFARPAPAPADELRRDRPEVLAEELRERLGESVHAHLLADVPVGVLLSGGIDSSVLTALAARSSSQRVQTFSIGFRERSFNELELAREVARRYETDHHELVVSPRIDELLPRLAT